MAKTIKIAYGEEVSVDYSKVKDSDKKRVQAEVNELEDLSVKLGQFVKYASDDSEKYTLTEASLIKRQKEAMWEYYYVLKDRLRNEGVIEYKNTCIMPVSDGW